MLIRKKTSILYQFCFKYEQRIHPIQCTASKICECNSIDKLILWGSTGFVSFLGQSFLLCSTNCFCNGKRQYSACLYQLSILMFTYIFFVPLYFVHFRQETSSFESVFSMSANCCTSTTARVIFSGEVFGVISTTW